MAGDLGGIWAVAGWLAWAHAGRVKPPRTLPPPPNHSPINRPLLEPWPSSPPFPRHFLHPMRNQRWRFSGVRHGGLLPRRASSLSPHRGSASSRRCTLFLAGTQGGGLLLPPFVFLGSDGALGGGADQICFLSFQIRWFFVGSSSSSPF